MSRAFMASTILYLDGGPAIGKLTIARDLSKLVAKSHIVEYHRMIEPLAAIHDRYSTEYDNLQKSVQEAVIDSAQLTDDARNVLWIFTNRCDFESSATTIMNLSQLAGSRNYRFLAVTLQCEELEILRRLSVQGSGNSAKPRLVTPRDSAKGCSHAQDISQPRNIIDVTNHSSTEAASHILDLIDPSLRTTNGSRALGAPDRFDAVLPPAAAVLTYNSSLSATTFEDVSGFKHVFIDDILGMATGSIVSNLICWVKSRPRRHGNLLFLDAIDSSASIQVVVRRSDLQNHRELANLWPESSLSVSGVISRSRTNAELLATNIRVISPARHLLTPAVRGTDKEILSSKYTDAVLTSRHIYIRNPILATMQAFRSKAFFEMRVWFEKHRFIDFSAPLITPSILYSPAAAIHISNLGEARPLYLSQCAGFYLEAGAHAHERVYNLGPSFRNESRTNRHLMEYWHIIAELSSGILDDMITLVEIFLREITEALRQPAESLCTQLGTVYPAVKIPFPRITYRDAIALLQERGQTIAFGDNVSKSCEDELTTAYGGRPVWVTHKPRSLEPFPYRIDPNDQQLCLTADLVAPGGFGEICGVAEKSWRKEELAARLAEKGKSVDDEAYAWVSELRDFGLVPHTAFGMGFERAMRWLVGLEHVKDAIPFPRMFGRYPLP